MKGLIKYCFANSFSILANIGVASQFYLSEFSVIASALFGILAGLILNYFLSVNLSLKNDIKSSKYYILTYNFEFFLSKS